MIHKQEDIDYLAEVVVSHLVTNKRIDESDVYVHLLGVFRRFFSREIEKIENRRNEKGVSEWHLFIHREGLYDLLPEGFFHSTARKYFKDREETLKEFRTHREEEERARLFFLPVEQEFFKYNIHKEIFEQNFFYSPETIQEFTDFFNFDDLELNMYQKAALFFILPHIPSICGNISLTETCFRIILQEEVSIRTEYTSKIQMFDDSYSVLGLNKLGLNSIIGNYCIDNNQGLVIQIGPLVDTASLMDYLFGIKRNVLLRLRELFIQADLYVSFEILLNEHDRELVLGEKDYQGRLNYSTNI